MPLVSVRDTTIFYRLTGPEDRPVLILSHSLGQDHGMWDAQVSDLSEHFRVLRYDIRGHGASPTPRRWKHAAGRSSSRAWPPWPMR
jgi:3-oxoadipate enol-lactonase